MAIQEKDSKGRNIRLSEYEYDLFRELKTILREKQIKPTAQELISCWQTWHSIKNFLKQEF